MYYKLIDNGHVLEVYAMERAPVNPHALEKDDFDALASLDYKNIIESNRLFHQDRDEKKKFRECRKDERRAQTIRDARNTCKRLAVANFNDSDAFLTLTVARNCDDVTYYDSEFKKFIMRFNYKYGKKHKYLAVREFQKRGAIHYHLLMDFESAVITENEEALKALEREVADIWRHGFVDIQTLTKSKRNGTPVDNVGAYLVKYMSKENDDSRLRGNKVYLCSRGLKRPVTYTGEEALAMIQQLGLDTKKETFTNGYESEYLGKITYREYNLNRMKKTVETNS